MSRQIALTTNTFAALPVKPKSKEKKPPPKSRAKSGMFVSYKFMILLDT